MLDEWVKPLKLWKPGMPYKSKVDEALEIIAEQDKLIGLLKEQLNLKDEQINTLGVIIDDLNDQIEKEGKSHGKAIHSD